jgi:hypothetical protein
LARVCDEQTGAFIAEKHRQNGVEIRTGTTITARREGMCSGPPLRFGIG